MGPGLETRGPTHPYSQGLEPGGDDDSGGVALGHWGWDRGFRTVPAFSLVFWHHPSLHWRRWSGEEVLTADSVTPILWSWKPPRYDWGVVLLQVRSLGSPLSHSQHPLSQLVGKRAQTPALGEWGCVRDSSEQLEDVLPFDFPLGAVPGEGLGHCISLDLHPWLWADALALGGGGSSSSSSSICFLMSRHPVQLLPTGSPPTQFSYTLSLWSD